MGGVCCRWLWRCTSGVLQVASGGELDLSAYMVNSDRGRVSVEELVGGSWIWQ